MAQMAHQKKNLTKRIMALVAQMALPKQISQKNITKKRGVSGSNSTPEKIDHKNRGVSGANT